VSGNVKPERLGRSRPLPINLPPPSYDAPPLNLESGGKTRKKISHDARVMAMALAAGLPGVLVSMVMLWGGDYTPKVQWTLTVIIVGVWLGFAFAIRERVVIPLQTLSNLLAALREGEYSIRARGARTNEALGQVMLEANVLGETLYRQRMGAVEATKLLQKVMEEIDVAVFTFDEKERLSLVNRAGERLLAQTDQQLMGLTANELGLHECLEGEPARTLQKSFPGKAGRWGLRRSVFREGGLPHHMLVLTDLSQALREEERQAWKRLIRVLRHEIGNSLAPIKSMASTLLYLIQREPPPHDWKEDAQRGLSVIADRSESLSRFMEAYSRLARLPQPTFQTVDVGVWVRKVVALSTRLPVEVVAGPELRIQADGDQLDQLLINLIRNAVDASLETGGGVRVGWSLGRGGRDGLEVWVEDDGPGIPETANLFVPFFTTKPGGSGIGLVLSRQIAEAHGGSLTLENRKVGKGCEARLRLPLEAAA